MPKTKANIAIVDKLLYGRLPDVHTTPCTVLPADGEILYQV
jgi:hypothetical protein